MQMSKVIYVFHFTLNAKVASRITLICVLFFLCGIFVLSDATGVVLHKDSLWYQQWKNFKDNNPVVNGKNITR